MRVVGPEGIAVFLGDLAPCVPTSGVGTHALGSKSGVRNSGVNACPQKRPSVANHRQGTARKRSFTHMR
ncbi:hypothetical protein COCVIDRAFT_114110 [Bipolaris victoriae FI3]|uniref:Uncharacterized protein n=2 Tax=Bipolaris TaxID=33194 RepID=W6XY74_COCC2|nr:uncharacterized protein COCCADRAFT_103256 [Bipolaris zeicola 26-R-13]XP_014550952.1 hypothetical protein COCVIDRAFT_114110 [Bipolaris victoriae FI3]EUC30673.1 hypothetical protein COCCADRAFT_103256 [Bipolaris zeicola 26-R-13]